MAKRKPQDPPAGVPEWMATYGDLVTLLLCFFVLLYASADVNIEKFKGIAAALSGNPMIMSNSGTSTSMLDMMGNGMLNMQVAQNKDKKDGKQEKEAKVSDLKTYFAENNLSEQVKVEMKGDAISITFLDGVLFDSGKSNVKVEAYGTLDLILNEIKKNTGDHISIYGHTDNDAINTVQFPDNWHLSSSRAINVGKYFISSGLDPVKINVAGKGEYFPIAPNDTKENKGKNRRVEILISDKSYNGS